LEIKKIEDVPPGMFTILLVGVFLWVIYGISQKDMSIVLLAISHWYLTD